MVPVCDGVFEEDMFPPVFSCLPLRRRIGEPDARKARILPELFLQGLASVWPDVQFQTVELRLPPVISSISSSTTMIFEFPPGSRQSTAIAKTSAGRRES
jgi:hypothetical protein